jgi:hypothetical protein
LSQAIERSVPVDGLSRRELLLEISKGANGRDQERADGFELFIGQFGIIHVLSETPQVHTEENGFLIEVNAASVFEEGQQFTGTDRLAIVAMLDGVLVAFFASRKPSMGCAAGRVGAMDGPGLAGFALPGGGGAAGGLGGHESLL